MKTVFTLLAIISCALSSSAFASEWKTLAGFNDTVTLKEGETAFIVNVSEKVIVQYEKKNRRSVQFHLDAKSRHQEHSIVSSRRVATPSVQNPFALSGPCKITTKTRGVVSMKIVRPSDGK